jgi:soluble lytic murein transglycosylase
VFKSVLVAVVLGLSGPRCPPSSDAPPDGPAEPPPTEGAGADADAPDTDDDILAAEIAPLADAADQAPPAPPTDQDRLGAAVQAFRARRWAEAETGFHDLFGVWPELDGVLRYWAMEAAYRDGRFDAARSDAEALAQAGGVHAADAAVRAADIAFEQGRWTDAAAGYQALGERLPRSTDERTVRFRLGRCREELGDTRAAKRIYEELVRQEPDAVVAAEAEARLRALDPAFSVPPAWRLERARILVRHRDWAEAIAELDLIPAETTSPSAEEVAFERANAIYKHRRRYEEAAQAFAAVIALGGRHATEAEFLRARSLARANLDDEAIAAYREFATRHPDEGDAVDAQYLAALLELQLGRFDAAIAALEALVGRNRTGPGRPQARWSLGLAYLLAARPAEALELIDGTADDEDDASSDMRAAYWGAVARLGLDRQDEAEQKLRAVIADSPLHWYAMLARQRLAALGVEVPPPYPERTVGRSALVERCDELPAGVNVLRAAGLRADAQALALPALRSLVADARGDELRDLTAKLLCVDAVYLVHRHVGAAHQEDWGLRLDETALPYWEAAYPRAWRAEVEAAARREGMSPYFVWSIMRQESSFEPDVVSSADAIGLLQMIPPTTTRMLERRGETYDDELLFDPERNIELGVEYIAWIGRKFHDQLPLQAAGYNGGPHNVARWLDGLNETRLDYFVERIPFEQTRNYVRRVLTAYARYLFLYEHDDDVWPVELPLELRRDYLTEPSY